MADRDLATAKQKGLVFCVSGPSGTGKGTVIHELMQIKPDIAHSVSATTRSPRAGEQDGVDYYFVSRQAFESMLDQNMILEHDVYCGNYYGTPRARLDELVSQGIDVVMDITVPGSLAVMANYPEAVTLFLLPPSFGELERRLKKRGTEDEETVRRRLDKARDEIAKTKLFTYAVINDDVKKAAAKILAIIEAEHCRYDRQTGLEDKIMAR